VTRDRRSLEADLVAHPDDLEAHAAYADWLTEHGDPRGEFIQVQLALEDENATPAQRREWQRREKELLAQHQREWLGGLAPFLLDDTQNRFAFARGWLDRLTIHLLGEANAEALALAPQTRLLRELRVLHLAAALPDANGEYHASGAHRKPPRWHVLRTSAMFACSNSGLPIRNGSSIPSDPTIWPRSQPDL
jgi:uncharacterized protein (TIGR02996 family)